MLLIFVSFFIGGKDMELFDNEMKTMGFLKFESSIDEENINRVNEINAFLFPHIIYERKLSLFTSLIIEAEKEKQNQEYTYTFYKIKYDRKNSEIRDIKLYSLGIREKELLSRVQNFLNYCGLLS